MRKYVSLTYVFRYYIIIHGDVDCQGTPVVISDQFSMIDIKNRSIFLLTKGSVFTYHIRLNLTSKLVLRCLVQTIRLPVCLLSLPSRLSDESKTDFSDCLQIGLLSSDMSGLCKIIFSNYQNFPKRKLYQLNSRSGSIYFPESKI